LRAVTTVGSPEAGGGVDVGKIGREAKMGERALENPGNVEHQEAEDQVTGTGALEPSGDQQQVQDDRAGRDATDGHESA
jgi:hypothetical protein